jgi:hypothetical protein
VPGELLWSSAKCRMKITSAECARGLNAQVYLPQSPPHSRVTAQIKPEKKTAAPRKPCSLPGIPAQRLQEIVDATSHAPASSCF